MPLSILVVDDERQHRDWIRYELNKEGYQTTPAQSATEAMSALEHKEFDVALVDWKMANIDGLELLQRIRARWPQVIVLLMSGYSNIPTAVEAVKLGASNFLSKPFNKAQLSDAIKKALAEHGRGGGSMAKGAPFDELPGNAPEIAAARDLAATAAATDKPVLLLGETGSGKEALARAIHQTSPRHAGPFVMVRCVSGTNVEVELAGSPGTGNVGKLLEANGGTIYLDHVGDLPADAQARLLRFIQDGEIVRGGALPPARSDARVITASTRKVDELVAAGTFRQDLYLRLKGTTIRMPALRERKADLPKLIQHYSRKHKPRSGNPVRFDKDAMRVLASLPFEGNLKELEDIVEQAVALALDGEVTPAVLEKLDIRGESEPTGDFTIKDRVEIEEKKAIEEALRRNPKNLKQAAKELNISRTTLWRKMRRYGLDAR